MRAAPAVSVHAAGGRSWRAVQALLPALAAGAVCVWALLQLEIDATPAVGVALAAGLLGWLYARPRKVVLAWDGQRWTADGTSGTLHVMIDLGPWLLLRLRPDAAGGERWIACTAAEAGPAWHALRAAVYSRPSQTTPRVRPPERAAD